MKVLSCYSVTFRISNWWKTKSEFANVTKANIEITSLIVYKLTLKFQLQAKTLNIPDCLTILYSFHFAFVKSVAECIKPEWMIWAQNVCKKNWAQSQTALWVINLESGWWWSQSFECTQCFTISFKFMDVASLKQGSRYLKQPITQKRFQYLEDSC